MVAYGITDYISLSGGISLVPGFSNQLFYINLKGRPLHLENFDLSSGAMYSIVTDEDASGLFTVYTAGTIGNAKNSLTLGTGLGFESEGGNSSGALFLIGGDVQVSRSIKLIAENWLYPADDGAYVLSLGARFFGRQLAADFALVYLTDNDGESISGFHSYPGWDFITTSESNGVFACLQRSDEVKTVVNLVWVDPHSEKPHCELRTRLRLICISCKQHNLHQNPSSQIRQKPCAEKD